MKAIQVKTVFLFALGLANPIDRQTPLVTGQGTWGTTLSLNPNTRHCEQLSEIEIVQDHRLLHFDNPVIVEKVARERGDVDSGDVFVSIYAMNPAQVKQQIEKECSKIITFEPDLDILKGKSKPEIIPIIMNGDPKNRIDVVFMGDGYTAEQREQFEDDMRRLVNDMWSGATFESFLPLFNVWAIFVPSKESGIGVGGRPKNTAFGLYRDGTELRGIYTSKASEARSICKLTGPMACDYPSLIGNDAFYGGLGGEFVIATRSETSGTVVLRHEMGHNFVGVGEEYDGGNVYSGVNAARSLNNIGWSEWLTEPKAREESATLLLQDYAWYDLAKGEYVLRFNSNGSASSWKLQITASGMDVDGALRIILDGKPLNWTTKGTLDRTFFVWKSDVGLSKGFHEIVFQQGLPASPNAPIRQLCSVNMHEYASEPLFRKDDTFIGAYPTWDINGRKSYRPTNEGCLMRNMLRDNFCPVCIEGMWFNLLQRLSFIDGLTQKCEKDIQLRLQVLPVGQFRVIGKAKFNETLKISWFKGKTLVPELNGLVDVTLPIEHKGEKWTVKTEFISSQIRKKNSLVNSSRDVTLCA